MILLSKVPEFNCSWGSGGWRGDGGVVGGGGAGGSGGGVMVCGVISSNSLANQRKLRCALCSWLLVSKLALYIHNWKFQKCLPFRFNDYFRENWGTNSCIFSLCQQNGSAWSRSLYQIQKVLYGEVCGISWLKQTCVLHFKLY